MTKHLKARGRQVLSEGGRKKACNHTLHNGLHLYGGRRIEALVRDGRLELRKQDCNEAGRDSHAAIDEFADDFRTCNERARIRPIQRHIIREHVHAGSSKRVGQLLRTVGRYCNVEICINNYLCRRECLVRGKRRAKKRWNCRLRFLASRALSRAVWDAAASAERWDCASAIPRMTASTRNAPYVAARSMSRLTISSCSSRTIAAPHFRG